MELKIVFCVIQWKHAKKNKKENQDSLDCHFTLGCTGNGRFHDCSTSAINVEQCRAV